ncbi:thymidine phosphorylase [Aureibacillus halotolerans]|uniref:Pyrimidine-nucleoside phosphorylase n=1 Tax=Aureibacillus halotolerans TaxID=1508390 RepID=A0A4R6UET2_9BACI|nr:thymidine phosphorylase [Aureibacillus halotolerans]TDQ41604.1 pyrimidine-nucleoside phosphorylase [Aureibacillus halotolerans]
MRMTDVIERKRDGKALTGEEIKALVKGYTEDSIPDYQMSAFLMAVYYEGMSDEEVAALTDAMATSGETLDYASLGNKTVDKHSTGGVGDKTTFVVAPLAASCGIIVPKMSGRGLGHTGGTIDKLEAIPGFKTDATKEEFNTLLKTYGMAVVGQTQDLAPADKKIYALRDVTATVESLPLIASSVMSKKIAAGAKGIVLDVKVGSGAFMKSADEARKLASTMVSIGEALGRKTIALLTNMDQPLGYTIGNLLEVEEAIDTLKGEGPEDVTELSVQLVARMLMCTDESITFDKAYETVKAKLLSGEALEKFISYSESRGADRALFSSFSSLYEGVETIDLYPEQEGYIHRFDTQGIGRAAMWLGAGRADKTSQIDPAVGLKLLKKSGDFVSTDTPWVRLYVRKGTSCEDTKRLLQECIELGAAAPDTLPLIIDTVTA